MPDLTRIDAAQAVEITDGVSQTAAVSSVAPGAGDSGLVVRNIPSGTQNVDIVNVSATDIINTAPTGTELGVVTRNIPSGTQNISDGGGSITVDGTVTANQGTAAAGSGAWPVAITDTSDTVVKAGDSANNAIRVNVVAGSSGGVSHQDRTAFTEGTTNFVPVGGVFNQTLGADLTEDQAGVARVTAKRALHVNLRDTSATELGTNTNPIRVDPTGTTTQPVSGTVTANIGTSGPVGTIGSASLPTVAVNVGGWSADNTFRGVTVHNSSPADDDYAFAVRQVGQNHVMGDSAHDAIDTGQPVKIGGQARTTNPTAVANADRVNAIFDKLGRQVVVNGHIRELVTTNNITLTDTSETTLLAAGGAGVFHDVTMLVLSNSSNTAVRVDIRDTTDGTVLLSVYLAANGGGAVMPFNPPMPQTTANANWTAQLSDSVTDVRIKIVAIKNL